MLMMLLMMKMMMMVEEAIPEGGVGYLVSRYISSISRRPLLCRQAPSVSVSCISESPLLTFGSASDVDEGTAGVPPKQPM